VKDYPKDNSINY